MMMLEERGLRYHRNLDYTPEPRATKWGTLTVEQRNGSKFVTYKNELYVGKEWTMETCFSAEFTDHEILQSRDVWAWLGRKFGGLL